MFQYVFMLTQFFFSSIKPLIWKRIHEPTFRGRDEKMCLGTVPRQSQSADPYPWDRVGATVIKSRDLGQNTGSALKQKEQRVGDLDLTIERPVSDPPMKLFWSSRAVGAILAESMLYQTCKYWLLNFRFLWYKLIFHSLTGFLPCSSKTAFWRLHVWTDMFLLAPC